MNKLTTRWMPVLRKLIEVPKNKYDNISIIFESAYNVLSIKDITRCFIPRMRKAIISKSKYIILDINNPKFNAEELYKDFNKWKMKLDKLGELNEIYVSDTTLLLTWLFEKSTSNVDINMGIRLAKTTKQIMFIWRECGFIKESENS